MTIYHIQDIRTLVLIDTWWNVNFDLGSYIINAHLF